MGNEVIYLQHAQNPEGNGFVQKKKQAQGTLEDMIAKSVAAALDACETAQEKEKDSKGKDG